MQAEAAAAAERAELVRQLHTQEGLRERADIGMHEAVMEAAAARQAESTLRVDVQVWVGTRRCHQLKNPSAIEAVVCLACMQHAMLIPGWSTALLFAPPSLCHSC